MINLWEKKRIDSQATETKDPEVCRLSEEPYENNSDGSSIGFLMVFFFLFCLLIPFQSASAQSGERVWSHHSHPEGED